MAYVDRYDAAMSIFIARYARNNIHTNIRARVVAVDYSVPSVDVQPMASTEFDTGVIDNYPVIFDVPLHLPSGSGGKARLTMPVKPGDYVGLSFSERNESSTSDTSTHQLFAGWAVTQIFTEGNTKAIHPDNVILENDKGSVTLTPGGDITIQNPKVKVEYLTGGEVKITNGTVNLSLSPIGEMKGDNGAGSFTLAPSGQFICNGAQITTSGRIVTANGIDLDNFFDEYRTHRHGGVENGQGVTDAPIR